MNIASERWPDNLIAPAYRIKREVPLRVPDLLLTSVGFIAEVFGDDMSANSLDPVGTSFLVSMPSPNGIANVRFCYAVTARHILEQGTPNARMVIIVNKRGGGVGMLPLLSGWIGHPDSSVDVAVIAVKFDAGIDVRMFDIEDLFDESNNPENIGPGDEVFFPGLFTPAPGHESVIPLVRSGNIAMMPKQQIQTSDGYQDMYLIEARSIGGVSGSPVFARETVVLPNVVRADGITTNLQGIGRFKLLGLIKRHWDVEESRINQAQIINDKRGVNLGIAQVVPAKKIAETLNQPALIERRARHEAMYLASLSGGDDAVSSK